MSRANPTNVGDRGQVVSELEHWEASSAIAKTLAENNADVFNHDQCNVSLIESSEDRKITQDFPRKAKKWINSSKFILIGSQHRQISSSTKSREFQ